MQQSLKNRALLIGLRRGRKSSYRRPPLFRDTSHAAAGTLMLV